MVFENETLQILINEGKKKGYILITKLLELVDEDSDNFDDVSKYIESMNIDLVKDEEIISDHEVLEKVDDTEEEDYDQSDTEFGTFSNEIEKDIKTKDIDDIVSTIKPTYTDDPIKMYLKEIG